MVRLRLVYENRSNQFFTSLNSCFVGRNRGLNKVNGVTRAQYLLPPPRYLPHTCCVHALELGFLGNLFPSAWYILSLPDSLQPSKSLWPQDRTSCIIHSTLYLAAGNIGAASLLYLHGKAHRCFCVSQLLNTGLLLMYKGTILHILCNAYVCVVCLTFLVCTC